MHRIVFIDSDSSRRAQCASSLMKRGFHVEPLEKVDEMQGLWSYTDVILAEDRASTISRLPSLMLESGNWIPVIAYSESALPSQVIDAVRSGAVDYLKWPFTADQLELAIEEIETDRREMAQRKFREVRAAHLLQRLSKREREVLTGVAEGMSNRLIGDRLHISPRTVEVHRAKMMAKIGVASSSEAVRVALDASLVS